MRTLLLLTLAFPCMVRIASPQGIVPSGKPTRPDRLDTEPFVLFTEGPTGTGNRLEHNELLSLGSATVGQGPTAGTLVRLTNAGRGWMTLDAPRLVGTNAADFMLELESSTLPLVAESALPQRTAPLHRLASVGGAGLVFAIDARRLADLHRLREVALRDFWLPDFGPVTLVLRRRELPFDAQSKLVVDGREVPGGLQAFAGRMQVWSGYVSGLAGSRVFFVVDASAARGVVELPPEYGASIHIGSDGPGRIRIVPERDLPALALQSPTDFCQGQLFAPQDLPRLQDASLGALSNGPSPTTALTVAQCSLAIETDWQFCREFNTAALATSYVTGLVAAVSDRYLTDVQTTLSIAYLGLHMTSNDGWASQESGGDTGDLLDEFRARWGSANWPVEADLAHFLSGANLGGGLAYVNVLCNNSIGYGVSANLDCNINWQTWSGAPGHFWDFMVFAHELGHNFGSLHTHDYCPPLDQCYGNCNGTNVCTRGTIMSYCHLCAGGVSNVDLRFHPTNANIMRVRVNSSCLEPARVAPGDFLQYHVRFNPLFTAGAKSAILDFVHDAPNVQQPFRAQLSGTAN